MDKNIAFIRAAACRHSQHRYLKKYPQCPQNPPFIDKNLTLFWEGAQPPPQTPPQKGGGTPSSYTPPRRLRRLDLLYPQFEILKKGPALDSLAKTSLAFLLRGVGQKQNKLRVITHTRCDSPAGLSKRRDPKKK